MKYDQEIKSLPVGVMIYGSLMAFFMVLCLTLVLAVFTEFDWAGVANWPHNTVYLVAIYCATVYGSIAAGRHSGRQGWIVGGGVGIFASLLLLLIAFMSGRSIQIGIFLIKACINAFIGLFGGIIGVNLRINRS